MSDASPSVTIFFLGSPVINMYIIKNQSYVPSLTFCKYNESVPPKEAEHAANQWGELTSVVDMYMHPSNNVNRKYPTPSWVTDGLKQRNAKEAFKLRV